MPHIQTHSVLQASVYFCQKGTVLSTKLQKVTHFKFYTNPFNCLWLLTFGQTAEQRNTTKLTREYGNFSFRKEPLKDMCVNFSISRWQKLFFPFTSVYASWHCSKKVVWEHTDTQLLPLRKSDRSLLNLNTEPTWVL